MARHRRRDIEVTRQLVDDRATRQVGRQVDDRHVVLVPDGEQGVAPQEDAVAGNARATAYVAAVAVEGGGWRMGCWLWP